MKKITLTLRLAPDDALDVLSMLNKKKAISDMDYIKKSRFNYGKYSTEAKTRRKGIKNN